jgi:putative ABC transport system permease protein
MAFTRQAGLVVETALMAFDTLRTNKMRSALTVLGVVIGVTSIVGMTSLIRGFDTSLRDSIAALGPKTIFVQRFGAVSFSSGASFMELIRRPVLNVQDGEAIRRLAPSVAIVDTWLGAGPPGPTMERMFYQGERTRPSAIMGTSERFVDVNFAKLLAGRVFTQQEVERHRRLAVIGFGPYQALFEQRGIDPIGKHIRIGGLDYTVVGVIDKRPAAGGFSLGQDDFAIIPYTAYRKQFGNERVRRGPMGGQAVMIAVVPRDDVAREDAMREVEAVMRIRHGLTLDQPNDFDLVTQDAVLKVWEQISQAVLLSLVVISSIALMVGGIGVMAIMTISVTERTREIGVRKAIGARRLEILTQFLIEAVVLTSIGGVLGIVLGSSIGLLVNVVSGFPVSLPWWSFALGLGFSAAVGVFEALRYE